MIKKRYNLLPHPVQAIKLDRIRKTKDGIKSHNTSGKPRGQPRLKNHLWHDEKYKNNLDNVLGICWKYYDSPTSTTSLSTKPIVQLSAIKFNKVGSKDQK